MVAKRLLQLTIPRMKHSAREIRHEYQQQQQQ